MSDTANASDVLFWPYVTADLPGVGGELKVAPEDFVVEEIPAYAPRGEGEHTLFTIEKVGRNTLDVVQELAARLGVPPREFGMAGLKDRQAVVRQQLSVRGVPPERLRGLILDGVRVLSAERHPHKLRRGHLRGNRFRIRLRNVHPDAVHRVPAILAVLQRRGVPNGYGPQRFGAARQNHLAGRALLRDDAEAWRHLDVLPPPSKNLRSLYLSAYQAWLFNRYLAQRIIAATYDTVIPGDVAQKHATGGLFIVEDAPAEAPRAAAFEISATGPIYGYRMMRAREQAAELEQAILAEEGLTLEDFRPVRLKGSRRVLRWRPEELRWELDGSDLVLNFVAPKGAYATALLREVRKRTA